MSLFGDLPPPSAHLRPKQESRDEEYKPKPFNRNASGSEGEGVDLADADVHDRQEKRQRFEETKSSGFLSSEQIAAALTKIGSHISNPDKFSKATGLLRQMLDSGALTKAHRNQLFEVVKAAFSDFDNASEPSLRRDYMKLCHSLDKHAEGLFGRAQRAQLEVYRIVGFLQNEMHTDDSFVFNKVLGRIKDAVAALPSATEKDEEALAELQEAAASSDGESSDDEGVGGGERQHHGNESAPNTMGHTPLGEGGRGDETAMSAGPIATAGTSKPQVEVKEEHPPEAGPAGIQEDVEDDAEADPFGLEQLLPAPKRPRAPPLPPSPPQLHHYGEEGREGQHRAGGGGKGSSSNTWTTAQALVMRRQALIECLITSRGFHKTPWARTGVELLVEHYNKHRNRFTTEQLVAVDEMVRFVRAARQARPTGPSQKEINRDTTSFERARSEWSRATLSARGKVGASGDAKSQNWLG
ncbi:hypothetical protein Vretimale_17088 [Volvox reticuliferus]|uniref:Uncharacterized protein n=1 Tax=Volvox reticuliferus TaxID=1737510 RepID=A0A8J4CW24_9CHLO|nr:hypothetical protein Vretifemale_18667 [Volvox reticuliferus]GIM14059.1 hypothetical protein Vretimale_17088 [Volvox reticuliferus]